MNTQKIMNIEDLRRDILDTLDGLKDGSIRVADAKERSNAAGKVLGTLKTQLVYSALRKEIPHIPFMAVGGDKYLDAPTKKQLTKLKQIK